MQNKIIKSGSREAFEHNRKILLDRYKKTGRIRMIEPRDPEHARLLAKAIAKKIQKENKYG